ncbi:hypothetical protein ONZ45_g11261 [Pleurotus djamor]|nr:hypothetical protein ONZ45_g11261 [Pleurotus djamor]
MRDDQANKDPSFPPEIFQLIVAQVGLHDRSLLHPLLFVSKEFYSITVPLLYESIVVAPVPESLVPSTEVTPLDIPAISIHPHQLSALQATLNDPKTRRFGEWTKAYALHDAMWFLPVEIADDILESFRNILSLHLVNVQRLSISVVRIQSVDLRLFIPQSLALTHLTIEANSLPQIAEVLQHQPSLRVVYVKVFNFDMSALEELDLPNLHTLSGPAEMFESISKSPVENLDGLVYLPPPPLDDFYVNIRILKLSSPNFEHLLCIFPHLKRVEYLSIVLVILEEEERFVEGLLEIPSPSLRYLSFCSADPHTAIVERSFAKWTSLQVVDLMRLDSIAEPDSVTRHFRHKSHANVNSSQPNVFGQWWLSIDNAVKAAESAGPSTD